jgi:uncharacterized protein (DUF58 family)
VITLAGKIAAQNGSLEAAFSGKPSPESLDTVLRRVAAIAHHDHLVVVISDFDGHSETTRDTLLRLADRNDIICILVYDPFLLDLPISGDIVVSGGGLQAELPLRRADVRQAIGTFARDRGRELRDWQRQLGLPMLPVSAAEDTAPQLRRLLEQASWRQRRR